MAKKIGLAGAARGGKGLSGPEGGASSLAAGGEDVQLQIFRSLADRSQEFIGICDLELKPFYVNESGRRLVGLGSLEEACATRVQDFFFPEDQRYIREDFFPKVLREGAAEVEIRFRHFQTGAALWMIYSVFHVRDAEGRVSGYATVSRNITDRKRAEEAMRSVALFPEENPFPVARVDAAGTLLFANRASSGLLAEWQCATGGRVPEGVRARVQKVLEAGEPHELEMNLGGRTISFVLVPIEERGYVNLYGRDVTAQRAAEAELRKSEERYQGLFEDDLTGDFISTPEGRILLCNPAFARIFGFSSPQEAEGTSMRDLYLDPAERAALVGRVKRHRKVEFFEAWRKRRDGTPIHIVENLVGHFDERGELFEIKAYVFDDTERKRAEEKLRESEERLRQAAELVGLCPYTWEPATGALEWIEGGRKLWGPAPDAKVNFGLWQAGVHPDDRATVEKRVASCLDPNGDGNFEAEYRVSGVDGVERWVSVRGRTRFVDGKAVSHTGVAVDVTKRRRDEEAVRQKAEELRAVLDAAPVAVWVAHDPECRVITGNAYADELIMGTARGANISMSAPAGEAAVNYRVFREGVELRPEQMPAQRSTATKKPVPAFAMELVFADGRKLSLMAGAVPLFNAAGAVRGAIVAGLDVTPLKNAEEGLRQAEERARLALQAGRMGTWDRMMPNGPTVWNEDHYRILGYDSAQIAPSNKAWAARVHPDDLRAFYKHLSGVRKHGGDFSEELRILWPDSSVRWVELRGSIQCDANGQPKRSFGVVLDFTDRRRAELALRETEEHFRSITDTTPVIMWMTNATGGLEFVNRAYREFFGVTLEQVAGPGRWQPPVHPEDAEQYVGACMEALSKRGPFVAEARLRRADGQWRWIQSFGAPRFNEEGEFLGLAGSSPDVTERKEFQAELERLVAERTNKLQELVGELEHFSYTITHDLKSPLRAMRGFAELVGVTCGECERGQARQFLGKISSSAERMDHLIADALNYSRSVRQELPLEDVDAGALLRGILDSYPELQPDKARIRVEGQLPVVLANEAGLTQCFSNLLGNAVKFVPAGETPEIRVWASGREGWVRIWVEDKGIGIAKEILPRVFDMFMRGSKDYEGTGIGLALVRKVAQRMGGRVGVESEEGKGSRFWLELKSGEDKRSRGLAATSTLARGAEGMVLYVEDEESDAMFMERAFAAKGLSGKLRVVGDGRQAIDYLSRSGDYSDREKYPVPALVLLDLNLPHVPGFQVLEWMRNNPDYAQTPVVVFSSSTREDDRVKARELGASEFVSKPNSGMRFGQVVEELRGKWMTGVG